MSLRQAARQRSATINRAELSFTAKIIAGDATYESADKNEYLIEVRSVAEVVEQSERKVAAPSPPRTLY